MSQGTEGANDNPDFVVLHRAMRAIVDAQDRDGWPSAEIERASKRILQGLWACAHNKPPLPTAMLGQLASDIADLEAAKKTG